MIPLYLFLGVALSFQSKMRFWIEMAPQEDQKTTSFLPTKFSVFGQLQLRQVLVLGGDFCVCPSSGFLAPKVA
jgi:hypothetical protein